MEIKKFTQIGTISLIVMIPILIFCLITIIISGFKDMILVSTCGFLALTMVICLLIFFKLTIYLNDTSISFKLGIGLITRKYMITDIQSCKTVRNDPLSGIGIRKISGGWLYNVSGLNAIELTFKNKNSKVRIGTDKPDEIAEILSRMINVGKSEISYNQKNKSGYFLSLIIILVSLIFPALLILSGSRDTEVTTTDADIRIQGMYGLTIKYSEIIKLDTISELPGIKLRTNGYALGESYKGNFRLRNEEKAKLFIKHGSPPYILIKTDKLNIYLNFKKPVNTVELYNTLTIKLKNKTY
ncbi:MAG TPA: hypothetical protein VF346_12070 [Bacteroidales bacterium]